MSKALVCSSCGYIGRPKRAVRGSGGVELILWFFFIIPGLIYSIWRSSSRHNACPVCGSTNLVPVDSPNGRKMLESQGKTVAQVQAEVKAATMPLWQKGLIGAGSAFGFVLLIFVIGWFM